MAREKLKDWTGRIIGETEWVGNRQWLYDWTGRKIGYYDRSTNKTYDWTGRMVGQGNTLLTMLR